MWFVAQNVLLDIPPAILCDVAVLAFEHCFSIVVDEFLVIVFD
jgi:hypothetical protein